ncbi:DoxX family protein [Promicromonospora sp. NPDC059942]|uniref:DoxX family protein n=1 Tax=Promicromonospora sp. NPDC059942 TaxID=3347009 RepID=UPI00364BFF38
MSLDASGPTRTETHSRTPTGTPLRAPFRTVMSVLRRAAPVLGWVVTLLVAAQLAQGAYGQLTESDRSVGMFEAIGFPASAVLLIGVLQGVAVLLYVVPWTAFLGALLLTAYLGGAVAAHVRLEDALAHTLTPVLFAVGVWAALFLRSERIRGAVLTGR